MEFKFADYKLIFENLSDGIYFVNSNKEIVFWNSIAEKITGFTSEEIIGSSCSENLLNHIDEKGEQLCTDSCPLMFSMKENKMVKSNVFLHHKYGHRIPVHIKVIPINDELGNSLGAIEIFTDTSESKQYKIDELEKLAMEDVLTSIPNRRYLEKIIEFKLNESIILNKKHGMIFMDIDNFKIINDRYGHDVGDKVLQVITETLIANIRSSDIIGRWGGEEFVGILSVSSGDELKLIAEKLRILIEKTEIAINKKKISVTVSVGATILKKNDNLKKSIKRADKLMYTSKKNGKNQVTVDFE